MPRPYRVLAPVHTMLYFVIEADSAEEAAAKLRAHDLAAIQGTELATDTWQDCPDNIGEPFDVTDAATGETWPLAAWEP